MANISTANLQDKDIRALEIKQNKYIKCIGNPAELYIRVYPSNKKTFFIRYGDDKKMIKLKEFRQGIYSVAEARIDAVKILKQLEQGKSIEEVKGKDDRYLFKNMTKEYLYIKENKGISDSYFKKIKQMIEKYLLPSLANKNIRDIKHIELYNILKVLYNPEKDKSRLETIHRLIQHLNAIFNLAIANEYITSNPANNLHDKFQTSKRFNALNNIDSRLPAITKLDQMREFLKDLEENTTLELVTKNAILLQILTANRPSNTVEAKWQDIDLENKIWVIPANQMKNKQEHIVALSDKALEILKNQKLLSFNEYVFSRKNQKHIARDTLSKAIRSLNNGKYKGVATPHGFRSFFKTSTTTNLAYLMQTYRITLKTIEECLSHTTKGIQKNYEREKATIKQRQDLMQWYANYIYNS